MSLEALARYRALAADHSGHVQPRVEALRRVVRQTLAEIEHDTRACIEAQVGALAAVHRSLREDARFVLAAADFRAFIEALNRSPPEWGDARSLGPSADVRCWLLPRMDPALGLDAYRESEEEDYDDERDFLARRIAITVILGEFREEVSVGVARADLGTRFQKYPLAEQFEDLAGSLEDRFEDMEVGGRDREALAREVACVALYAVPLWKLTPTAARLVWP